MRGWRNSPNSPWCFDGQSESWEAINLWWAPGHGFNKDLHRKPKPVDLDGFQAQNTRRSQKTHHWVQETLTCDSGWTVTAVYQHRFSSLFLLFISLLIKLFNCFALLLVRVWWLLDYWYPPLGGSFHISQNVWNYKMLMVLRFYAQNIRIFNSVKANASSLFKLLIPF